MPSSEFEPAQKRRAAKPRPPRYEPLLHAGLLFPYVAAAVLLVKAAVDPSFAKSSDFGLFYETIERLHHGLPMYGPVASDIRNWRPGPNYNPPHFYVLVAPFVSVPLTWAFAAWTLFSVACGALAWGVTRRAVSVRPLPQPFFALAWGNAAYAATICGGQLSLILALPVTLAWRSARSGRWVLAGIWLGISASVKPFLMIAAVLFLKRERWRAIPAVAASASACCTIGILAFGWERFGQWLGVSRQLAPVTHFENASVAGLLARAVPEAGLTEPSTLAIMLGGICVTGLVAFRDRDLDRGWLLLMSGALLWSPLGWVYYGWFLMPPIAAIALSRALPPAIWLWLFLWIWPPFTLALARAPIIVAASVGSIYFWGLVALWCGVALEAWRAGLAKPKALAPKTRELLGATTISEP